jgi:hypothetical protein
LVLRSKKVRIRPMPELEEAELEDPIMPNKWIYHKDTPIKNILNYILHEYEMFKNEDEMEKGMGPEMVCLLTKTGNIENCSIQGLERVHSEI